MGLFGFLLWFKTGTLFKYCDNMLHPNNNVRPKCPVTKKRTIHMILGIVFELNSQNGERRHLSITFLNGLCLRIVEWVILRKEVNTFSLETTHLTLELKKKKGRIVFINICELKGVELFLS